MYLTFQLEKFRKNGENNFLFHQIQNGKIIHKVKTKKLLIY